jgi:cell division transport system permease protein
MDGAIAPQPARTAPARGRSGERRRARLLRPARARLDELGLRRAISDRMLPFLVAAMAFLAALALAGAVAASALARHWQQGAGAALTVQVPHGAPATGVLSLLRTTRGILDARAMTEDELGELLRPWLGAEVERLSVPLPTVLRVRIDEAAPPDMGALAAALEKVAPGTLVESNGTWTHRLGALARSLQACAAAALLVVAAVAAAVVAVATRAGLVARREAIAIVHGLGATDGYIAARFAGRATLLAGAGAAAGSLTALPVLLGLARLAAPFVDPGASSDAALPALPATLWLAVPALPAAAAAIGWLTAQATVRRWLRRLP